MATRAFLLGLIAGAGLGVGATLAFGPERPDAGGPDATPLDVDPDAAPTDVDEPPPPMLEARAAQPTAADGGPFPPGEALLRIGDAYVFGEDVVRPLADDESEDTVDLICQDIRYGVTLRTPHGALRVAPPFTTSGEAVDRALVYQLLADAPEHLTDRNASLASRSQRGQSGVALIRGQDGRTYKVYVRELDGEPRAWKRRVRIAYAEVPVKADGGVVRLPGEPVSDAPSEASNATLKRFHDAPSVPSDTFKSFLSGAYRRITDLPDELDLQDGRYLMLPEPLSTKITTNAYSGILAEQGIAATGHIVVRSYTGIAVDGDLDGTVDVQSYAYVHVTGDVTGTIDCQSYTTVIIDGDVYGTINVGSYVTFYLKGRFVDPERNLKAKGSCWSTFFLDQHHSSADLERIPGTSQITLHVRSSDLAAGKHTGVGPWREVIVADDIWESLR